METEKKYRKRDSLNPLNLIRRARSRSSSRASSDRQTATSAAVRTSSRLDATLEPSKVSLLSATSEPSSRPSSTPLPPKSAEAPTPPSDLWTRAFMEANDETQKWIKKHGLDSSTGLAQPKDQIKDLIGLVESNKLSEQDDKPLKIEIWNQQIIVREYIAEAVAFITMVGDAAITFAPPQASVPWAVAKAVLKIPVKHIEQKAALLGTVQWFARIVRRGQIYEALYNAETTDGKAVEMLYHALFDVYETALELLASSDTLFGSGIARQTLSAILRPDSATGKVKDLFEKEQRLSIEVQACEAIRSTLSFKQTNDGLEELKKQLDRLSSPLPRVDNRVATLLAKVEKKELEELMRFISSEMFGKSHAAVTEARIENTGNWLLVNREFRAWQEISSSSAVLCLRGTVGTGKTYLTSKVVDYVKQTLVTSRHDEGFAFFYCNRSGPSMQDPIVVLRSFVHQLAGKAFGESDLIQSSLVQKCEAAKRERRELGYKDCKDLILESLNLYPKTTIILDALDESDITTYNLCTFLIEMMEKSRRPVKVFISTRPDRQYLEAFEDKCVITLDASNQQGDIDKYLEEKLYSTGLFIERSQDIQAKIKNVFATRSCGMFRWVYLQVKSLQDCTTDDAIHDWARELPLNLAETYDKLWQNITKRNEHDVALAERAIMWVLCSIEPLESEAFLEAIQFTVQGSTVIQKEKQTQQRILSLCQDLLTIDETRDVWMLPHASVAEYFETKGWMNWKCDLFASKVCLDVLENFWPERIRYGTFARYVQKNWGMHVGRYDEWLGTMEEGKATADPDLVEALKRFLRSPGKSSANYRRWAVGIEFDQFRKVVLGVCRYGIWYTLRDWWLQGEITMEMALEENIWGENSLSLAVESNCLPMLRHLVNLIDVMHPQAERHSGALKKAIDTENIDILEFLIMEANADVNHAPSDHEMSAAQHAAMYDPEMLQWLVDQGAVDLERENDTGFEHGNVLIAAAGEGKVESVQLLLKAGANVNAAVHNGYYGSALAAAVGNANTTNSTVVRLLLEHGANPNLPLNGGHYGSALEASVAHAWKDLRWDGAYDGTLEEEQRKVQCMLLEAGADPAAVFEQGKHGSVLAAAAFYGRKEILKVMIDCVGTDHAVEILRQSRHPVVSRYFEDSRDVWRWKNTAKYLAEEVGVDKDILHSIGLWDVEPDSSRHSMIYLLDYSKAMETHNDN